MKTFEEMSDALHWGGAGIISLFHTGPRLPMMLVGGPRDKYLPEEIALLYRYSSHADSRFIPAIGWNQIIFDKDVWPFDDHHIAWTRKRATWSIDTTYSSTLPEAIGVFYEDICGSLLDQYVFLPTTAFIGTIKWRSYGHDHDFVMESIVDFEHHAPKRSTLDRVMPKIVAATWPELRHQVMMALRQRIATSTKCHDDLKTQIIDNDHEKCTPMVLKLLWQRFQTAEQG
jgi:hypothetical protein